MIVMEKLYKKVCLIIHLIMDAVLIIVPFVLLQNVSSVYKILLYQIILVLCNVT